jgi:hypothetical protein
MPYIFQFSDEEKFFNGIRTYPSYNVSFYSGSSYVNGDRFQGKNISTGSISLFELNVDRDSDFIYPFIVKDGNFWTFKSVTTAEYNRAEYGDTLSGSYPLTSSLTREYISGTTFPDPWDDATSAQKNVYVANRRKILALQNTLNYNRILNNNYAYTGSYMSGNVNLLNVPSIYYGSSIKKGTLSLKFYFTGTLMDEAQDNLLNGEVISTMGPTSGSTVGMVLYNEGIVLLTNETELGSHNEADDYNGNGTQAAPKWIYFGAFSTGSIGTSATSYPTASLYEISFKGTNVIPTHTMFAHASAGSLNNSQNLTWLSSSNGDWRNNQVIKLSSSFKEPQFLEIKNTIQSPYCEYEEDFEKQVFISKIGLYDKDRNLIGVAKLANPVRKKESDQMSFKIKLDL